jgi:hypothetical protein
LIIIHLARPVALPGLPIVLTVDAAPSLLTSGKQHYEGRPESGAVTAPEVVGSRVACRMSVPATPTQYTPSLPGRPARPRRGRCLRFPATRPFG